MQSTLRPGSGRWTPPRRARRGPVLRALCVAVAVGACAAPATAQERERERERERPRCDCEAWAWAPDGELRAFRYGELEPRARALVEAFAGPRARMGITIDTEEAGSGGGARIQEVMPESPAEAAGLRDGDVIVALDGRDLLQPLEEDDPGTGEAGAARRLIALMRDVEPGDTVQVSVRRNGDTRTFAVGTSAARGFYGANAPAVAGFRRFAPGADGAFRFFVGPEGRERSGWAWPGRGGGQWVFMDGLHLQVAGLNPELGEYFDTREGVLVLSVGDDPALPLRPGDVIVRIGDRAVRDPAHLLDILRSYRAGEEVRAEIVRQGGRQVVEGVLPR